MTKQTFKIIDGVYSGPEVWEGGLDFRYYKDTLTSLGLLTEVGGGLDLEGCTNLVSLGSLKEVGAGLDLDGCTSLTSLGSLKEVAGCVYLWDCTSLTSLGSLIKAEGGVDLGDKTLSLQEVQEKISYYSHLPLHEALNALHTNTVQSVPLYKNILLQALQGG